MHVPRRLPAPAPFPWRRPRHELLLLVLAAVATLTVVHPSGAQDISRMCLTRAVIHGKLSADGCLDPSGDRAAFGGHLYSDKAPGLSFLAVPAAAAVRLPAPAGWHHSGDLRLWAVRLATGGIALLLSAFLVGRAAEGLAPGWGGATLVTFAAGTLAASLAVDNFDEVPAATLGFAAFLLAWRQRSGWAGVVAGLAVVVEYQAALVGVVVGGYAAFRGARAFGRYALGVVPGLALLGLYDRAAFGSPFHLSYRYVSSQFAARQAGGFFGVHAPSWHAARLVLIGNRGLIVVAPVLVLAAVGLVLLWRQGYRAESCAAAAVTIAFLVLELGYFDPYGGDSPGPALLHSGAAVSRARPRPRLRTLAPGGERARGGLRGRVDVGPAHLACCRQRGAGLPLERLAGARRSSRARRLLADRDVGAEERRQLARRRAPRGGRAGAGGGARGARAGAARRLEG